MKNLMEGNEPQVHYVINAEDFENVLREVIGETIIETKAKKTDRYLTIKQAAERLGVTKTTLWRWEKENYLLPVRFGSKVRYRESDIIALMEGESNEQ